MAHRQAIDRGLQERLQPSPAHRIGPYQARAVAKVSLASVIRPTPVIGAGGIYPPPPGYLPAVREICRARGVLFVADEVITGYGRTGVMFASRGIDPDIVLTAKGLTSGYLPMGAEIGRAHV